MNKFNAKITYLLFSIPVVFILMGIFIMYYQIPTIISNTEKLELRELRNFKTNEIISNTENSFEHMENGVKYSYYNIYKKEKKKLTLEVDNDYKVMKFIYSLHKSKKEALKYFHSNKNITILDKNGNVLESTKEIKISKRRRIKLINQAKNKKVQWLNMVYKNQQIVFYMRYFKELNIVIVSHLCMNNIEKEYVEFLKNRFKTFHNLYIFEDNKFLVKNGKLSPLYLKDIPKNGDFIVRKDNDLVLVAKKIKIKNRETLNFIRFTYLADFKSKYFLHNQEVKKIFSKLEFELMFIITLIAILILILSFVTAVLVTKKIKKFIYKIDLLNKRLLEQVKNKTKENQKIDNFFKGIFHLVPNIIIVLDSELKYLNVNKYYEDMFGLKESEVFGKRIGFNANQKNKYLYEEFKLKLLSENGSLNSEYEIENKNGELITLHILIKKIEIEEETFYVLVAEDVTEYKNLLNQYSELNKQLAKRIKEEVEKNQQQQEMLLMQSKFATMGEMIDMIAHQWRQPLNVLSLILININLKLQFGELDDNHLTTQLEKAENTIKHMSSTIDDFRGLLSKNTNLELVNLEKVIEKALSIVNPQLHNHSISVQVEIDKKIEVYINESEFIQVILNIISNAKDEIIKKELEDSVISIYQKDKENIDNQEYNVFCIEDEAGGIDEDIIEKVFDPYFSTKGKNGTGIGLYMSKLIVEKAKGIISVKNTQKGVVFCIKLPVYDENSEFSGGGGRY